MTKNIKSIFFILTLVMLLVTVGAVCAADDNGATTDDTNTSTTHSISEKTTTTEPVVKEKIENTPTKQITKTNKIKENKKTSTKTVQVNNYDEITSTINGIDSDTENDEYIINLNEGTYQLPSKATTKYTVTSNKNITINANNQNLISVKNTYQLITVTTGNLTINQANIFHRITNNGGNLILNNSIINADKLRNINDANLIIKNCTLNCTLENTGFIIIDDLTTLGPNFNITENSNIDNIITNNSYFKPKPPEEIPNLTNENITQDITIPTTGNATFTNCQINAKITNNGNLTLQNCSLSNNNMTTSGSKTDGFLLENNGNLEMVNCIIENNTFNTSFSADGSNVLLYGAIVNKGIMNIINISARNNSIGGYALQIGVGTAYHGNSVGRGSVIVNRATLNINASDFIKNYASQYGGAIHNEGNLTINNSLFENNTSNLYGGAISSTYLNHETIMVDHYDSQLKIENTQFNNNQVNVPINVLDVTGGGAICIKNTNSTINNCSFNHNQATSTITGLMGVYGSGGSIAIEKKNNDGLNFIYSNATIMINNSKFTNHILDIITNGKWYDDFINGKIENCIFENNSGDNSEEHKGIIHDRGNINITNNTFKNITATDSIIYNEIGEYLQEKIIKNNKFINNTLTINTILNHKTSLYNNNTPLNINITNNTYINTTINDTLELNTPQKIYTGEPITITGTYTLLEPENYDADILEQTKFNVYINGELVDTIDTLEFTITPSAGTMMVTVQPTISQTRKTQAIRATTLTNITITPENYNEYIYEGALIGVGQNSKISFQGQFTDKGEIYIDTSDIIIDGLDATFTNTKFTLDAENIVIQNMNINNTNLNYPISNYKDNNIISNNTITLNNPNSNATAIYNGASNTLIANNTLTVTALPGGIDFTTSAVADTQAILLLGGDKNIIQNNTINIKSTLATGYNTLEAITNSNGATNTLITQNNITISDANFNYAIDCLSNVENITITENTMLVTGERYCDGIQVGNDANNIIIDNNNITCTCINTTVLDSEGAITYGVITTSMGSAESNNITITNNNIDITGTVNYAIELYKVNNTEIHNNNITVNGPYSLGIGYSYAPNGNATGNTITITGDSTTPINYITEEIKPENTGIRIQNGTQNVYLEDNTITTSDVGGQDTTIHTEPDNVTIANNQLTSSQGYGDETIIAPTTTNIENNTLETTTTITVPETIITNTPVELTATVTIDETPINSGVVTFTKGNEVLAQAEVIDGVATATTTFKEIEDATITASYTPTSIGLTTSSVEVATSIQAPVTQLNIEDVNLTAGETVTLTATVTDQTGNNITGGKVTFKVNGKTVKDANGKVVYAKVVDGIAQVEYTVPDNLVGKDINITAVYSGSAKYNKESTTITKTVATQEPTLTITPITDDIQTGSTITLKAKVATGDKAITTGKIVFKINGKTVKDTNGKVIYAKVDANGEVSVDYNLGNLKAGSYTIEATFIAPGYDKITSNTTMTVVKA